MNDLPGRPAAGRPPAAGKVTASKGINSVEIGIRVLDVLARANGPLALRDISRLSELSPSQAHRYLASLIRQAMVVQDPNSGHYDLGPTAVRIGLAALNRLEPVEVAEEAVDRLALSIRETSMLAIWGESGPVAVRWKRGSRVLFASVGLGTTFPLLGSTTGRIFLALMPPEATQRVLQTELAAMDKGARKKTEAGLEKMIEKIRHDRYVEAKSHLAPGIWAASAPVFDSQAQLVACVTIIGLESDPAAERRRSTALLKQLAGEASERLGMSG